MRPAPQLRIRVESSGPRTTLWLCGELDLASAPQLDAVVAERCATAEEVILELGELSFMDSTGLRSVLQGMELCAAQDCELRLGSVSPQVARLLEVAGVEGRIPRLAAD